MPKEYEETLFQQSSDIIKKFMALSRNVEEAHDLNFSTEISKGICAILIKDNMYFMKDEYKKLISELKEYIDIKISNYDKII